MRTKVNLNGLGILTEKTALKSTRGKRLANISVEALPDEVIYELLAQIAYDTYNLSQELVPVQTGYLKSTGYIKAEGWTYVVGYGATYAPYVHEIIDNQHTQPTQAKFLQEAFTRVMQSLVARFGVQSIPDFDVRMEIDTEFGVRLIIMYDKKELKTRAMTWRRFIGA